MSSKSVDLSTPTRKILAIGHLTEKGMDSSTRLPVMMREVPATVNLYLDGKIEQWWAKPDASGVVFLLNLTEEAHQVLDKLPLGVAGMMKFDFIPLAPLTPLRLLMNAE
jgi:hypothetical protein